MAEDSEGNVYLTGAFSDSLDFGGQASGATKVSRGFVDSYVVKFNPHGQLAWVYQIGGTGSEYGYRLSLDNFGNVYVIGIFTDSVDFDEGLGQSMGYANGPSWDIFVCKLDTSGSFKWAKSFGGIGDDRGHALSNDDSGNVYIGGVFSSTLDFNPNSGIDQKTSLGGFDAFVIKLDSSGSYKWGSQIGGAQSDRLMSLAIDNNGDCLISGSFERTVDFDPSSAVSNLTSVIGSGDIFMAKYNPTGSLVWAKRYGSTGFESGYDIQTDLSNNIYLTGLFQQTVSFGTSSPSINLTSKGGSDGFIAKYSSLGALIWARGIGDTLPDQSFSCSVDRNENVYIRTFHWKC